MGPGHHGSLSGDDDRSTGRGQDADGGVERDGVGIDGDGQRLEPFDRFQNHIALPSDVQWHVQHDRAPFGMGPPHGLGHITADRLAAANGLEPGAGRHDHGPLVKILQMVPFGPWCVTGEKQERCPITGRLDEGGEGVRQPRPMGDRGHSESARRPAPAFGHEHGVRLVGGSHIVETVVAHHRFADEQVAVAKHPEHRVDPLTGQGLGNRVVSITHVVLFPPRRSPIGLERSAERSAPGRGRERRATRAAGTVRETRAVHSDRSRSSSSPGPRHGYDIGRNMATAGEAAS